VVESKVTATMTRQTNKPRLLDLFCGAGGAARGYQLAGFHVIGIDAKPQPRYAGDEFIQADAMTYQLDGYAAIHASPPCQAHSTLNALWKRDHPDLVAATRERLQEAGAPWVIENVPGAPLRNPIILCGSHFGLGAGGRQLRRHRLFESSFPMLSPACDHHGQPVGIYGTGGGGQMTRGYKGTMAEYVEAMQMPWATRAEIAQAIPPAYTEYVGAFLMAAVKREVDTPAG
jgi:DNA (cytosine-5)-methyltransferase 1